LGDSDDSDDSSDDENYEDSDEEDLDDGDGCAAQDMDYDAEDAYGNTRPLTVEETIARKEAVARDFQKALTVAAEVRRSDLSRERIVKKQLNLKPGKVRNTHHGKWDPKQSNITVLKRVQENPGECLSEQNGYLWCGACNHDLSRKASCIKLHCKSASHRSNKVRLDRQKERHQKVRKVITLRREEGSMRGSTLSDKTLINRAEVARAFLIDGICLSILRKHDGQPGPTRALLEESKGNLGHREVSDCIPALRLAEQEACKEELFQALAISFSMDGTTEVAELFNVVVRYVSPGFYIQHRCISLQLLFASLTGEQQGALLTKLFLLIFQIAPESLHYGCADGCPANGVAMRSIQTLNPRLGDTICLSHSSNVSGSVFTTTCSVANAYICSWATLISKSAKARLLFAAAAGEKAERKVRIRFVVC
jgi:hypothetical protein